MLELLISERLAFQFRKTIKAKRALCLLLFILMGYLVACSSPPTISAEAEVISGQAAPPLQRGQVRQWAVAAEASSEFADPEWAAIQATNAPDTARCGDYQTAWATAGTV